MNFHLTSDEVNGLWEVMGGFMLLANVFRLYRDKEVKGVGAWPTAFFTSWGLWNCFFYPINGLVYSFLGGMFLASVNLVWLCQMLYYIKLKPANDLIKFIESKDNADL